MPGTPPIVHAEPAAHPTVVAGDGDGVVDVAGGGPARRAGTILYAAALAPGQLDQALADQADLVLTDTQPPPGPPLGQRPRERRLHRAGRRERPLVDDPTDNRLDVFPGAGDDAATVTEQRGVESVQATAYGNPVTYTPEDRAANALDGDPRTAWRVGAFSPVEGERLVTTLTRAGHDRPHHTAAAASPAPATGGSPASRLRFDGGDPLDVDLDDSSRDRARPAHRHRPTDVSHAVDRGHRATTSARSRRMRD